MLKLVCVPLICCFQSCQECVEPVPIVYQPESARELCSVGEVGDEGSMSGVQV